MNCGSGGTADALASGASGGNPVEVQILSTAPFLYSRLFPKDAVVVERQTRHFEGVVGEIPYGFKSHRPHQLVQADVVLAQRLFCLSKRVQRHRKKLLKACVLSGAFVLK